jgi:hypothetical protein
MSIKKINEFPVASGVNLTSDDIFLMMDDPSGSATTKKVSLATLSSFLSGGSSVIQLGNVSGVINTNASLGNIFDLTLAASGTLANPTNPTDGQTIRWRIGHNANNLVLNFGNQFRIPSSATSPLPLSSTSGNMDILGATYDSSRAKWDVIAFVPGY